MNNTRRKALRALLEQLSVIRNNLEELTENEENCRDNMPEGLWDSEQYEAIDAAADNLRSAVESLEEAESFIDDAIE